MEAVSIQLLLDGSDLIALPDLARHLVMQSPNDPLYARDLLDV